MNGSVTSQRYRDEILAPCYATKQMKNETKVELSNALVLEWGRIPLADI